MEAVSCRTTAFAGEHADVTHDNQGGQGGSNTGDQARPKVGPHLCKLNHHECNWQWHMRTHLSHSCSTNTIHKLPSQVVLASVTVLALTHALCIVNLLGALTNDAFSLCMRCHAGLQQ